jgi:tRNA(fMet)-specific endonuclease VapC
MKKILLDTNAYSYYLRGDERVLEILSKSSIVYMSIFVLAELYYGFKGGSKEKWNKGLLENFLNKPTVSIINASSETSEIFADVKHLLKRSGNPIPLNDIWIASHSIETGSILITFDDHFNKISGLRIWDYS